MFLHRKTFGGLFTWAYTFVVLGIGGLELKMILVKIKIAKNANRKAQLLLAQENALSLQEENRPDTLDNDTENDVAQQYAAQYQYAGRNDTETGHINNTNNTDDMISNIDNHNNGASNALLANNEDDYELPKK